MATRLQKIDDLASQIASGIVNEPRASESANIEAAMEIRRIVRREQRARGEAA